MMVRRLLPLLREYGWPPDTLCRFVSLLRLGHHCAEGRSVDLPAARPSTPLKYSSAARWHAGAVRRGGCSPSGILEEGHEPRIS